MDFPANSVVVFEENRTRGELYSLWLDEYDVDVAATKREADTVLDGAVVVAVLNQGFADGAASKLLEIVRARAPLCRVVATRERSDPFPDLNVDHQLVKPVFEEELVDLVETLLCRANYHLALSRYYQTNVDLSAFEIHDGDHPPDRTQYDELQQRASKLQKFIARLTKQMEQEDIRAVKRDILLERDIEETDSTEKIDSKYRPGKCTNCGQRWDGDADGEPAVTQLGAYVWRCGGCGHVQMAADPSHQHVNRW